jgi:lipoprotein-anchoring transpeptidase ErfK/SrfK
VLQRSAVRIVSAAPRPALIPKRARMIHVRLAEQTLVAYEGDKPVFATLVSSGKPGFDTPPGIYRIWSKHISTTMDGVAPSATAAAAAGATLGAEHVAQHAPDPGGDEAYSIEDVPWTMYFQGSYALHAAFWHERFGQVRSHGCVNLAPADARWLFRWSTPVLPADWHGVIATSDNPGTWVWIE